MSSVQPRIQILSEEQKNLFYEKALWVLETVGVKSRVSGDGSRIC